MLSYAKSSSIDLLITCKKPIPYSNHYQTIDHLRNLQCDWSTAAWSMAQDLEFCKSWNLDNLSQYFNLIQLNLI